MTDPGTSSTFTSDLTVDEFIVLSDAGWEPLEFVSGDCTSDPGDGHWSVGGNQGERTYARTEHRDGKTEATGS
jgi:hypothetical protein